MVIQLVIWGLVVLSLFPFYRRKLTPYIPKPWVPVASLGLTAISLAPMGWILGLLCVYGLPKLWPKNIPGNVTICAKCGTLAKKGATSCQTCKNTYI